jgi:hypothetical protein
MAPAYNPLWGKRGSKVPMSFLLETRAPTKLQDIITSHGGEVPEGAKIPDMRKIAIELLESQGLLIKPTSAVPVANVAQTEISTNTVLNTGKTLPVELEKPAKEIKEMVEETLGSTKTAIETYKQITPEKTSKAGLVGVPDNGNTFAIKTLISKYTHRI